jgi:hypothetical protein
VVAEHVNEKPWPAAGMFVVMLIVWGTASAALTIQVVVIGVQDGSAGASIHFIVEPWSNV